MGYKIQINRFDSEEPEVIEGVTQGRAQLEASNARHHDNVSQITIWSERDHVVFTGYRAAQGMSLTEGQDDLRPPTGPPASRLRLGRAGEPPNNAL